MKIENRIFFASLEASFEHPLAFTAEGQVLIDNKPIKELSHPEIKAAIKSIAKSMQKQSNNDGLVQQYDRQTTYLLTELQKCKESRK